MQQAPKTRILGSPIGTLEHPRESHSQQLSHDDAQGANTPLVRLVVGHEQGAAQHGLKEVHVGVGVVVGVVHALFAEQLDLVGRRIDLGKGMVHHGAAEHAGAGEEVGDCVNNRRCVEGLRGVEVAAGVVC